MSLDSVPPVPFEAGGANPSNPWAPGEMPPGPPLPLSDIWVQYLTKMFPSVDPGILAQYAAQFKNNMGQMVGYAISQMTRRMRAAAQQMKEAIEGND